MVAATATVAALATGCGANGQPDALEACKSYTLATTGVVSTHDRSATLADAERWAGKAVDKSAKWQPLLDAIREYRVEVTRVGAGAGARLNEVKATIQTSCESAARGY
jgi:hypothetical protein